MDPLNSPLLIDLYQLNMIQAYLDRQQTDAAVFEFFVRKLPGQRNFLMAAGLEPALDFLENLRFSQEEIDWLAQSERFRPDLLAYLANFRFTGDVDAMAEGTVFFPDEPILRVTAPLPQAQLVETRLNQYSTFPDRRCRQGRAYGARRARQAVGRFRFAPRPRCRGRADGG